MSTVVVSGFFVGLAYGLHPGVIVGYLESELVRRVTGSPGRTANCWISPGS